MSSLPSGRRSLLCACVHARIGRLAVTLLPTAALWAMLAAPAAAHDFKLGPLRIDHPYATPTPPGVTTGAAYLRGIRNAGALPDRLLGASTPAAHRVEIHRSVVDAQNVMRMRAIDGIDLPPGSELRLRHGGDHHLMLIDLKSPLKNGERFPMTLRFEKAGEREVMVWVQQPRDAAGAHEHRH
jgi:copper(I)-binding protein